MIVKFDYPMATEENMKAIQNAIHAGMDYPALNETFGNETVWDCIAVLSGNKDTAWQLLDHVDGSRQTRTEDWQDDIIEDYIEAQQSR